MEKYGAAAKYFVVEMIKKCWDNDGEAVKVGDNFPLDYIQEKNIGETKNEQQLLVEYFLASIEQDEYITYDEEKRTISLLDFVG